MRGSDEPDLRDKIEYAGLVTILRWLAAPSIDASRGRGRALGRFAARFVPLRRDVAVANLRRSFPDLDEAGARAIYRRLFENLGVMLADFARGLLGSAERVVTLLPEDLAKLEAIRDAGRGGLFLSAHFGNWEGFVSALSLAGFPVTALGARQRNPLVEALFSRQRERAGMHALTRRQGLRAFVRELRAGRFVATLADQDGGRDGFFLPFLGRPASVQPGLFRVAVREGLPLVIGFATLTEEGWVGHLDDPVEPRPVAGREAAEEEARRLAAHYTARVEEEVRRRPDHWFWVHRRWHTRPPGEAPAGCDPDSS